MHGGMCLCKGGCMGVCLCKDRCTCMGECDCARDGAFGHGGARLCKG